MVSIRAGDIQKGNKIIKDGVPFAVVEVEHYKPGKAEPVSHIKMRNLHTGAVTTLTSKVFIMFEKADIQEENYVFSYKDGDEWHFMHTKTFDQISCNSKVLGDSAQWLKEESPCQLMLWDGAVIDITLPSFVYLQVTETAPGVRGDTVSGASKPATLETGATIKVPLFINEGDMLKIKIVDGVGTYESRAKE